MSEESGPSSFGNSRDGVRVKQWGGDPPWYLVVHFERDEYATSVIVIAAAGLYWRRIQLSHEVSSLLLLDMDSRRKMNQE